MEFVGYFIIFCNILNCNGINFREELDELLERQQEYEKNEENDDRVIPSRRTLDLHEVGNILGAPSMPSHLPEAEPILPGHTLIRPALGMLKSSVKFPHRDLDNGAGVYGNINNLGIRYDGRNERVLYSGFRRSPADFIMVVPIKTKSGKRKFAVSSVVLDLDNIENMNKQLSRNLHGTIKAKKNKLQRLLAIKPEPTLKFRKLKPNKRDRFLLKQLLEIKSEPTSKFRKLKSDKRDRFLLKQYPQSKVFVYGNAAPKKTLRNGLRELDEDDDGSLSDEEDFVHESAEFQEVHDFPESSEEVQAPLKNKWFWESKDLFTHVKIHPDAPEYSDLMPVNISKTIRNWWFYHQDDFRPFHSNSAP